MVRVVSIKSGFRTTRDLLLFCVGLGVLVYHLLTVPANEYSLPIILFSGGLMGAPYIIGKDEHRPAAAPASTSAPTTVSAPDMSAAQIAQAVEEFRDKLVAESKPPQRAPAKKRATKKAPAKKTSPRREG